MGDKENPVKLWIDGFAAFATFLAILIGVWQFNRQQSTNLEQEQENRQYNDAVEFRRRTWENQQVIYLNIAEVVGIIASEQSAQKEKDSAIAKFNALYYGKAVFVEDSTVENAMRHFSEDINDFQKNYLSKAELQEHAYDLVHICKNSSYKSWLQLSKPNN